MVRVRGCRIAGLVAVLIAGAAADARAQFSVPDPAVGEDRFGVMAWDADPSLSESLGILGTDVDLVDDPASPEATRPAQRRPSTGDQAQVRIDNFPPINYGPCRPGAASSSSTASAPRRPAGSTPPSSRPTASVTSMTSSIGAAGSRACCSTSKHTDVNVGSAEPDRPEFTTAVARFRRSARRPRRRAQCRHRGRGLVLPRARQRQPLRRRVH